MHWGGNGSTALCGPVLAALVVLLATITQASAEQGGYRLLTLGGHPVRWSANQPSGRIALSYKIADRDVRQPNAINCKGLTAPDAILRTSGIERSAFREALRVAFQRWRDTADISFVEVDSALPAQIVIGEQTEPIGFAFTNLDLSKEAQNGFRTITGASICLNPKRHWKIGYDGNLSIYDLVHTFAHEIGHVIGLDHPAGRKNLMSFRYSESLSGLSEGDRMGAVALYGASRIHSEIVALPQATSSDAPPKITTTIGRSMSGNPADRD